MKAVILALSFVSVLVFAEDVIAPPTAEELAKFLEFIGGLKGLGVLAIAAGVVQALVLLFRTQFGALAGKYQLLIITFLSLVGGVFGLMLTGLSLGAALVHSTTLAALQVFVNQLIQKFFPSQAS